MVTSYLNCIKKKEDVKFLKFAKKLSNAYEIEGVLDDTKLDHPNMRALTAVLGVLSPKNKVNRSVCERFLQWFGNSPEILSVIYALCTKPWFWGPFTKKQCEATLSRPCNSVPGTYMVIWDDEHHAGWLLCEVFKDKSKKHQIRTIPMNSAGTSMYAADQLIKKVDEHLKKKKKLSPAAGRPAQYSTVEVKVKWMTGGREGNYKQKELVNNDPHEEQVDLTNPGLMTHFNVLF